jgi:hypothetical protein
MIRPSQVGMKTLELLGLEGKWYGFDGLTGQEIYDSLNMHEGVEKPEVDLFLTTYNEQDTLLNAEYDAQDYARKRKAEYPPMEDYLDGVVKGDNAQITKYIDDCQAVKFKYPK